MGVQRLGVAAGCALPGALIPYFAFNSGGFGAGAVALAAVVLALGLAVHTTVADTPFSGASMWLVLGAGALALFAAWTAASGWWSDASARALLEADRALFYVLLLVAVAAVAGRPWRVSWMVRGIGLAIVVVAVAGLATRLYPEHYSLEHLLGGARLNYPVGYWNTLGLLAGMGFVLSLHLAADRDERFSFALPAAAVMPLLAATIYLTLSRGAIAATAVGLVVYLVLARTRLALLALLAAAPGVALALVHSYDADLLTSDKVTTAAAKAQGHDLAPWLLGAVLLAVALRAAVIPLIGRIDDTRASRSVAVGLRAAAGALVVGAVVAALALDAPHELSTQYHRFVDGDVPITNNDLRTRLTSVGNTGRTEQWEASFAQFRSDRLKGGGAGTYDPWWRAHRPNASSVRDSHSLYFEVIGELGIVGIALLAAALLALAIGTLRSALRLGNPVYAAAAAVLAMWLVRAGVDWDWEMPVVTVPALALAAAAAAGLQARDVPPISDLARILIGVAWVAIAITPALIYVSQGRLDDSVDRYYQADFIAARDKADSSLSALGSRPQPYEVIGYVDLHRDQPAAAITAMRSAVKRDPDNWRFHYGLALAQMAAGADARAEARRAVALQRFGLLPPQLLRALNATPRARWPGLVRRYRRLYEGNFPGVGAT